MKLKLVIIPLLFLFFMNGYSQPNDFSKKYRYYLVGTWIQESRNVDGYLVFKREIGNQKDRNSFKMEISNNGVINLKHTNMQRKCGNDYRKSISKCKWSLDSENKILKTSIPIIMGFKKFKILDINSRKMVLSFEKLE
ncbi:hypothetical protein DIS18_02395 [Algibacter marinivivus]|uniref:Lipocalin-like domain-containing protein n=1 Tax=Algibacter marinivivus TaxID=2100723 RepID=A0A2U2X6N9_9FLAO|nr:hypothetical protein [Algibacter marinivivus]PWH83423.1 hypothetical protein DIS18_02395 [Algibacter marinivivus]